MLTKSYESSAQPVSGIRSSVMKVVVDALMLAGCDGTSLLKRHELSIEPLTDPYSTIPLRNYVAVFEDAAKTMGQPALGIQLGAAILPESLGPVGVLFTMHPSLRMAITRFGQYFPALQGNTRLGLSMDGEGTWVDYQIEDRHVWPRAQDTEFTLALLTTLARSRLGRHWHPEEVHFEHSGGPGARDVKRFFGTIVRYEQTSNRMLIKESDLDKPLVGANAPAIAIVERHLIDLIGDSTQLSLSGAVALAMQRAMTKGNVSLAGVARQMGMGPRTLQRRLAEENLCFRTLLQERRKIAAESLLRSHGVSLGAVALSLGYSDAAVLSRAFKFWTGAAPKYWKG